MQIGSKVTFHSLGGDLLEGKTGRIVGLSMKSMCPGSIIFWIVQVDDPPPYMEGTCCTMISSCLKEI